MIKKVEDFFVIFQAGWNDKVRLEFLNHWLRLLALSTWGEWANGVLPLLVRYCLMLLCLLLLLLLHLHLYYVVLSVALLGS